MSLAAAHDAIARPFRARWFARFVRFGEPGGGAAAQERTVRAGPGRAGHPGPGRPADPGARAVHRVGDQRPARADPAAIRRHLDNLLAEGLIETRSARTYASRGRAGPGCSRSPTPAAVLSSTPTTTWPAARCASWPPRPARPRSRSSPATRFPSWSAGTARCWPGWRPASGCGPWPTRCPRTATPPPRPRHQLPPRPPPRLARRPVRPHWPARPRRRWPAVSSCASTTARSRTWPRSSRSCVRRRPRPSAGCWAARYGGSLRSPRRRHLHHARHRSLPTGGGAGQGLLARGKSPARVYDDIHPETGGLLT